MPSPILSYQKRTSLIHRTPALLKLLALLGIAVALYLTGLGIQGILFAVSLVAVLISSISFKDFLHDLKPVAFYSLFIAVVEVVGAMLYGGNLWESFGDGMWKTNSSVLLVSRLVVAMSYTSLFFRTTSNLEIRQSLERVELAVSFGHSRLSFSRAFALFLNFLPQLFAIWTGLDKTWKARCGKRGIRKIIVLLPVFIALSMKKANDTLMSLKNRR